MPGPLVAPPTQSMHRCILTVCERGVAVPASVASPAKHALESPLSSTLHPVRDQYTKNMNYPKSCAGTAAGGVSGARARIRAAGVLVDARCRAGRACMPVTSCYVMHIYLYVSACTYTSALGCRLDGRVAKGRSRRPSQAVHGRQLCQLRQLRQLCQL